MKVGSLFFLLIWKKSFYFWTLLHSNWIHIDFFSSSLPFLLLDLASSCSGSAWPCVYRHTLPRSLSWNPWRQGGILLDFKSPLTTGSGLSLCSQYRLVFESSVLFERKNSQPRTKFAFQIIKIPRKVKFRNSTSLMLHHAYDTVSFFHLFI